MYAKVESAWVMVGARKFLIRSISSGRTGETALFSTLKKAVNPAAHTTAQRSDPGQRVPLRQQLQGDHARGE